MNCVRVKPGVEFGELTTAGIHMLSALDMIARQNKHDITVTSARDGDHSGPDDPHKKGNAFDVRTHDLPDKEVVLQSLKSYLGTEKFYAFLESSNTENEHIHVQLAKLAEYP